MNYGALKSRTDQLTDFDGFADLSPAPTIGDFVNEAYRKLCWDAGANLVTDSSLTTTDGTAIYTLPGAWNVEFPFLVSVNGVGMRRTNPEYERHLNPGYLLSPSAGTPRRFHTIDFSQIVLIDAPSDGGHVIRARGVKQVTALSADGDETVLPDAFDEEVAQYAAALLAISYATPEDGAMSRAQAYLDGYAAKVLQIQRALHGMQMTGEAA